jgi:minor extracellular serine protease Vpr
MKRGFVKFLILISILSISPFHIGFAGKDVGAVLRKASLKLRERLIGLPAENSFQKSLRQAKEETFDVFIQTRNPRGLEKFGVQFGTILDGQADASVPLSAFKSLLADPDAAWIEPGAPCKPMLDYSIPAIGVDKIRAGIDGMVYTGKGVIVGIYDTGIDWLHRDFINPDGTSRILYLWDQTDDGGPHPFEFEYGTEYVRSQINDELDGHTAGVVLSKDLKGHGTHVAGIACGNGRASGNGMPSGRYVGVAPEADLIVVKGGDEIFVTSKWIEDGINYVFLKAESLQKPSVVNLSVGVETHEGPHDGTSAFEQSIDRMLEEGGRAVVVAAGNYGEAAIHFKGEFTSSAGDDSTMVSFRIGANRVSQVDFVPINVWYWPSADFSVSVVSPGHQTFGPVAYGFSKRWDSTEGTIEINNASAGQNSINGDMNLNIQVSDYHFINTIFDNLASGIWQLVFKGRPYIGKQSPFEGWLCYTTTDAEIIDGADFSSLIVEPGHARQCITVGSYVSRAEWPSLWSNPWGPGGLTVGELSSISSPGPSRPNSMHSESGNKPELVAPGEYVLSAFSQYTSESNRPTDFFIASDSVHCAMKGTSMAAPHVTGTIALLFQANPNLHALDIKNILISSAQKVPEMGGKYWDNRWGFGSLDAYSALLKTSVQKDVFHRPLPLTIELFQNYPNPFNTSTVLRFNVPASFEGKRSVITLQILDPAGREISRLYEGPLKSGEHQWIWDGRDGLGRQVPSGIYLCRLRSVDFSITKKITCIR